MIECSFRNFNYRKKVSEILAWEILVQYLIHTAQSLFLWVSVWCNIPQQQWIIDFQRMEEQFME